MNRWRWYGQRLWHAVTPTHLVFGALLLLAILLEPLVIRPLQAQVTAAEVLAAQQQRDDDARHASLRARASRQRTAQDELLGLLPPRSAREEALRRPELIARLHNLTWLRTEYRVDPADPALPGVEHLLLRSSLQGEYPAMRAYIGQLLKDMPNVGIDTLSFARANNQAATLQLDISLYFRSDGKPSGGSLVASGAGTP